MKKLLGFAGIAALIAVAAYVLRDFAPDAGSLVIRSPLSGNGAMSRVLSSSSASSLFMSPSPRFRFPSLSG